MSEPKSDEKKWLLTVGSAVIEAVGLLTIHFAHLEEEVEHLIWSLIAAKDVIASSPTPEAARVSFQAQKSGQAITMRLSFRQKVDVMEALAFEHFSKAPEILKEFGQLKKDLRGAAEKRNRAVHSIWSGFSQADGTSLPGVAVSTKPVRDSKLGMAQSVLVHSQEELADLAESFSKLSYHTSDLRRRCFP